MLRKPYEGVLNVATGTSVSIREMAEALADALAVPLRIDAEAQLETPQYDLIFQTQRLRDAAPDVILTGVLEGIREYVAVNV